MRHGPDSRRRLLRCCVSRNNYALFDVVRSGMPREVKNKFIFHLSVWQDYFGKYDKELPFPHKEKLELFDRPELFLASQN